MQHKPVLLEEAVDALHIESTLRKKGIVKIIDATLGAGGHTIEMVKRGAKVLAIDLDPEMIKVARERLLSACPASRDMYKLVHGNFKEMDRISYANNFENADGILFDLGVSMLHYKDFDRGFSFEKPDQELDMRLDPNNQEVKASDLINSLREDQLVKLFSSKKVAKKIIAARLEKKIITVGDLLGVFEKRGGGKTNPATKAFMDLRIAVNSEIRNLEEVLPRAIELLNRGGVLAVITFHSGEDRIVKNYFKTLVKEKRAEDMNKISPKEREIRNNPSARSAILRTVQKI